MDDLHKLLEQITAPGEESGANSFRASFLKEYPKHAFGRNSDGFPVLLVCCVEQGERRKSINRYALKVRFNERCHILSRDGRPESASVFTSLACVSEDETMQKHFAFLCEAFLKILGDSPNNKQILDMVLKMIDIFRKLSQPGTKELNGLLGELYYISQAKSPHIAVAAWHLKDSDKYDFSTDQVCVEVKTCSSRAREHQFSMEQCHPKTEHGLLISMHIERTDIGLSLLDLKRRIKDLIEDDPQLEQKFHSNMAQCLGDSLSTSEGISIDEGIAKESMRIYNLRDIPSIKLEDVPREVSQVKFSSNLATAKELKTSDLKKIKALANFLPKD